MSVHMLLFCKFVHVEIKREERRSGLHFFSSYTPCFSDESGVVMATACKGARGSRGCWDGDEIERSDSSLSLSVLHLNFRFF